MFSPHPQINFLHCTVICEDASSAWASPRPLLGQDPTLESRVLAPVEASVVGLREPLGRRGLVGGVSDHHVWKGSGAPCHRNQEPGFPEAKTSCQGDVTVQPSLTLKAPW